MIKLDDLTHRWLNFDLPKKTRINLLIFLMSGLIATIGIITSIMVGDFGYDFAIYYRDIHNFFSNGNPYGESNFYYLSYFYYLYSWVILFDLKMALLIHIFLTHCCLYYILNRMDYENLYERNWLFINLSIYLWFSITFNVNLIILFSLMFYQKNREKWYSPLILLLSFYKINAIPIFLILFFMNYYFEKKIHWKTLPALCVVFSIASYSLFLSLSNILYNIDLGIKVSLLKLSLVNSTLINSLILSISATHLIYLTYPIMLFTENKNLSPKMVKIIWLSELMVVFLMTFIFFMFNTNNMQVRMLEYLDIIFKI